MPGKNESAREAHLTPAQVLDLLGISRRTLERYIASGRLPALYLPSGHRRFPESAVARLLEERAA